ncbi:VOC family protein [Actinocrinis puniceicyclus]|uniref:VOC family protein n=1 Tax=Actinocrinis puniceicyclus TaxID=977794 RepID=A0A8J8BB09_9ACTN|nr:VOC family protein [Actinocrinis puniceicyclus]
MPARVSLVTLGVADLARATSFYRALGWPLVENAGDGVSFVRTGGALLSLFPYRDLAHDAGVPADGEGFRHVALAINVESAQAVDRGLAAAVAAGATPVKPGQQTFWGGYSGYFADPDGHLWEVAHNPFWPLDAAGLPVIPES